MVGVSSPSPHSRPLPPGADEVLAAAVERAREAAAETAGDPSLVGDHRGVQVEGGGSSGAVLTHVFDSRLPGYLGWHWAVTLARVPDEDAGEAGVTLDEVVLLPGEAAILAPAWVPWHERLRPGDLSVGDVLPATEDDARLAPSYTVDDDAADDPEAAVAAQEIALGRERVLSREGRSDAVGRWTDGEFGPRSAMARQAPGPCGTCGFWLPLAGSLRSLVGACGNVYAPADGRVVAVDYGCGAHSQATLVPVDTSPVVTSARYDTADFDVLSD
jgi:hypothetical protein